MIHPAQHAAGIGDPKAQDWLRRRAELQRVVMFASDRVHAIDGRADVLLEGLKALYSGHKDVLALIAAEKALKDHEDSYVAS